MTTAVRQSSLWGRARQSVERQVLRRQDAPDIGSPEWYARIVPPRPVGICERCGFEAELYTLGYVGAVCALCMNAFSAEAEAHIRRYVAEHPDRSDVTKIVAQKWEISNA